MEKGFFVVARGQGTGGGGGGRGGGVGDKRLHFRLSIDHLRTAHRLVFQYVPFTKSFP